MIPYDFLYNTVYDNFLKKLNIHCLFLKITNNNSIEYVNKFSSNPNSDSYVIFYDQEPLDFYIFADKVSTIPEFKKSKNKILISSEQSSDYNTILDKYKMTGFDYFYHALLSIEWYRQHWYSSPTVNVDFDRTYITYNNLMIGKRLYRSNLLIELQKRQIFESGHCSFNTPKIDDILQSANAYSYLLPESHKLNIASNTSLLERKYVLDSESVDGNYSAELDIAHLQTGFVNLVTETIFYENKVHLTEKIFKPICAKMPFILLGGPRNLEYLRNYGFKTFSDYWDESYDTINSPSQRSDAVLDVLTKLANTSLPELRSMKQDMTHILEHNYYHFYKELRPIVVNEFINGLRSTLDQAGIKYEQKDLLHLSRILNY
jgi:hypothetical protein